MADTAFATHGALYASLAKEEETAQLKSCTPFAAWEARGDGTAGAPKLWALPYADLAGWSLDGWSLAVCP